MSETTYYLLILQRHLHLGHAASGKFLGDEDLAAGGAAEHLGAEGVSEVAELRLGRFQRFVALAADEHRSIPPFRSSFCDCRR